MTFPLEVTTITLGEGGFFSDQKASFQISSTRSVRRTVTEFLFTITILETNFNVPHLDMVCLWFLSINVPFLGFLMQMFFPGSDGARCDEGARAPQREVQRPDGGSRDRHQPSMRSGSNGSHVHAQI